MSRRPERKVQFRLKEAHFDQHKLEVGTRLILEGLGVDKNDRNFRDTPERYARALMEVFSPKDTDWAAFPEENSDFILLRDHRLYSLCPHHLLPVKLYVSVAYIPNGRVLGLSKLARIAHACNTTPVLQETFTADLLEGLELITRGTHGSACLVEGKHLCMEMRGVKSDGHVLTYKFKGEFEENTALQERFFALCRTPRL